MVSATAAGASRRLAKPRTRAGEAGVDGQRLRLERARVRLVPPGLRAQRLDAQGGELADRHRPPPGRGPKFIARGVAGSVASACR